MNARVAVDLDGHSRPYGIGFDIGANEYWPPRYVYLPLLLRSGP
jgi:hypothetical protein